MAYKARLTVYADPHQIDALKVLAFKRQSSLSEYILSLLEDHIERMRRAEIALRRTQNPSAVTHTRDDAPLPEQGVRTNGEPDEATPDA